MSCSETKTYELNKGGIVADKNSKQELPSTPAYTQDPQFRQALADLTSTGTRLSGLDFSGGWNPLLQETTQFNPQTLQLYIDTLTKQLTPAFNTSNTDLRNQMAATGSLESSTASNALAKNYSDFQNTLSVNAGSAGLAQIEQALQNRVTLEGLGLNTLDSATRIGQGNEQNLNNFNLSNYDNQVAAQLYKDQNQSGGWLGALKGGVGGGLVGAGIGAALAIPTGGLSLIPAITAGFGTGAVAGGLLGGFAPQQTSNTLLQGGMAVGPSTMYRNYGTTGYNAGSAASNDIFGRSTSSSDLLKKYLYGGVQ